MRMLGGVSANGPSCSPIVSASRTESALFWRRLASTTIIRFFKVDVAGWLNCERASTSQSRLGPAAWSRPEVGLWREAADVASETNDDLAEHWSAFHALQRASL